jgi:D-3-phosphoglycerate dehydrogenase
LPRIPAEDLKRLHPYLALARRLGRVLAALTSQPLTRVEVTLRGRAAELDSRPLSSELLVGLLESELSIPVNRVNACHLAHRQGISLVESRSEETEEYVSLITAAGNYDGGSTSVAGTLIGDRPPRLVRIDDYEVETVLEGTLLITRHEDRPGVIGALGTLLGQDNVNISRMQVGIAQGPEAIAVIGISRPLPQATRDRIAQLLAIQRVYQVSL